MHTAPIKGLRYDSPLGPGPADGARARGNLACTSVPCHGAEWMSSWPADNHRALLHAFSVREESEA